MDNAERILIRSTNWIGDAIMNVPMVRAVRIAHPNAIISVLAKEWVAPVYENNPDVDAILRITPGESHPLLGPFTLARRLRSEKFDIAYILPNSFSSALSVYLAGIPRRVGYSRQNRRLLLTDAIRPTNALLSCHQVFYYLALVPQVLMNQDDAYPELYLTDTERAWARSRLKAEGIPQNTELIGVGPGAVFGPAKRWPAERFAKTLTQLASNPNRRFLLFGSSGEKPIAQEVLNKTSAPCVNFAGRTSLREMISLLDCCSIFLTNDSGAMHVAAALRIPIVAIFGSTNPTTTSPFGQGHLLIRHPVPCSPCLKRDCPTDFACMLTISPLEVAEACEKQIAVALPNST